jgi:putative spermidine/putrescine transport system ATP-binding protein
LNLLEVEKLDLKNCTCQVAGQTVKFEKSSTRVASSHPRLAIRPEELQIGTGKDRNALKGQVETVLFLGSVVRMRVKIGENVLMADLFNERGLTLPRRGDDVVISFPEHSCWVI